jgi:Zn-dependent peptidase ImmA (M78 family)
MAILEIEDLESIADATRGKFGFWGQSSPPDMMTIIVKMKRLGMIKNYRRVRDRDMPHDESTYDSIDKILLIPDRTFSAMNRGDPRAQMTLAEEIGHIALGHKGVRHRTTDESVTGRPDPEKIDKTIRREEAHARRFAAAFLAPRAFVDDPREMSAEELASRFNLSLTAAKIRKEELERLFRREHNIKRPLPQGVFHFLKDAKSKGFDVKSIGDED